MVAVRSGRFKLMMSYEVAERRSTGEYIGSGGLRKMRTGSGKEGCGLVKTKVPPQFISGVVLMSGDRDLVRSEGGGCVACQQVMYTATAPIVIWSSETESGGAGMQ